MGGRAADFPIFEHRDVCYLDSAATTQRPRCVLDAMREFAVNNNANVHRGMHALSIEATDAYEGARADVASFIGAQSDEIVFTRGTTEAINLIASAWGTQNVSRSDRILVGIGEHHSNIVPWQLLAERVGAEVVPIPITDDAELRLDSLKDLLDERVKLVAVKHVCNATGMIYPVRQIAELAQKAGAVVVVDGAQAPAHVPIDVGELGADFYAISSHKMYGPTGIGALWARAELLNDMPPYQGGGEMIATVSFERGTTYADPPHRFEAGTPHFTGAIGFAAATRYLHCVSREHERKLLACAIDRLADIEGVRIVGKPQAPIVSIVADWAHPHDMAQALDSKGVAVRAGHHCCMPLMRRLGIAGTTRASFGIYNDEGDIGRLVDALEFARGMFA